MGTVRFSRAIQLEYHVLMQVATGKVVSGKVVVEGLDLDEGQVVTILAHESEETVFLSEQEEEDLLESIAEADRGETISGDDLLARLQRAR